MTTEPGEESRPGIVLYGLVDPVHVERELGVDARGIGDGTANAPGHDARLVPLVRRVGHPAHERPAAVPLSNTQYDNVRVCANASWI